jgi:hypothetical protein
MQVFGMLNFAGGMHDGALPDGNSMQMLNLLKLSRQTGRIVFRSWVVCESV